ncbi:ARM repeat superfamily protein [Rhynchospora pubera]|uniref:ARM repeat superfamily protein n=1 Tax=Rhynchospora pubera TaxID=906938 RepID=A0AAV8DT97_9POAL|nr:ARM repeat superfamily protein [Rhynchospora pubera]
MTPSPVEGKMEKKTHELEENEENGVNTEEEEEEEAETKAEEEESEPPSHLPFAPPSASTSELIDDSTTVDPSYVISLIRQLLPSDLDKEKTSASEEKTEKEEPWEESGCILWDLAAAKIQAKVMVDNFILDVLLANLHASKSPRIKEICLGIVGNLACHESLSCKLSSQEGLIETVVQQLFLDDSSCLTEALRLLEAAIQTSVYASWSDALLSEEVLQRVLWILENTLNSSLFEKCIDFILAVIDNEDVAKMLLGHLMKLCLPDIAINLLSSEVEKSGDDMLARTEVLDKTISLVEGLSAVDGFLEVVSSKEKLIQCLCKILKAPDKFEILETCTSAVLVLANLFADENILSVLIGDFSFLEGLFDTLPVVADDIEARNAIWFIMSKVLDEAVDKFSKESLYRLAELILWKSVLIEESMNVQLLQEPQDKSATNDYVRLHGVKKSITMIVQIIEKWSGDESLSRQSDAIERAHRLLNSCSKYL